MSVAPPRQTTSIQQGTSGLSSAGWLLQRKSACGPSRSPADEDHLLTARAPLACQGSSPYLQRFADQPCAAAALPAARVGEALAGPGMPLESALRQDMEQRFGHDFGRVRVHLDKRAAESAREVGALAYTVGHDVVFAQDQFMPHSAAGRRLLAHELAHTVQQERNGDGTAASTSEARADQAASQAAEGGHVSTQALGGAPVALQAKPDDHPVAVGDLSFPTTRLWGFILNSSTLTSAHSADIDQLAWSISLHLGMLKSGSATISIVGHTDRSGDEKGNETLGQSRANSTRIALIEALKKRGIGTDKYGEIVGTSMGESSPAVPTADGIKNDKNRRVEINVSIGSQQVAPPAKPSFDPFAPLKPSVIPEEPSIGPPRSTKDDLWRRMQENQKKIEEHDRKHPPGNKSLAEILTLPMSWPAVIDKVMEKILDPLINKLPVSNRLQELARSGLRKALEAGSEAACDAAVDGTGATEMESAGLKSACKAALNTRPGGSPP